MAVGLRIRNQGTGQLQVASGYRNLELVKSGTMNTGSFVGGSAFLMSTRDNDYLHVIRFVSPTINANSGFGISQVADGYRVYASQSSPSKSLEYYSFGYSQAEPAGPVGLRMRSQDGTVFYDSRRKGLRVLAAVPLPAGPASGVQHVGQFFPGTRIGLAVSNPRYYYQAPYPEVCYMYTDFLHLDANNNVYMTLGTMWARTAANAFTTGNITMGNTDSTMLVIDLTEVPLGFG